MEAFLKFLRELFTLTPVWVEKGRGRWVLRRRLHPILRAILVVLPMVLGIAWGLNLLLSGRAPEPPSDTVDEPVAVLTPDPVSEPLELLVSEDTAVAGPVPMPEEVAEPAFPSENVLLGPDRPGGDRSYWVKISKGNYTLYLYRGKDLVKTYRIAVGRNPGNKLRVGDNRTPVGHFRVRSIENSQSWRHDFGDGNGMIAGAYGPWFIRLDTGWKGIGIHGTHDPDSRGTMATEGCIRMSNEEVRELRQYAYRNMKVVIEE